MPTRSYTLPDIHFGPGYLWYNVSLPAVGSLMLVDTDGNPTAGSPIFLGGSDGAMKITMKRTQEEIKIDQKYAPVDVALTAEEADIQCTLKQSQLASITNVFGPTYSSGTDAGLPPGAQNFQKIVMGGQIAFPQAPVAVISPRRGFSNPGKYFVFCLYNAYSIAQLSLSFAREKEMMWDCHFKGLAITSRAWPDDLCQLYLQTP